MAVVVIVVDDKGNVLQLIRQESDSPISKIGDIYRNYGLFTAPITNPYAVQFQSFEFKEVADAIRSSPKLNDAQKAEAFAVFNTFLPGDVFQLAQAGPQFTRAGDAGNPSRPPIMRIIDP